MLGWWRLAIWPMARQRPDLSTPVSGVSESRRGRVPASSGRGGAVRARPPWPPENTVHEARGRRRTTRPPATAAAGAVSSRPGPDRAGGARRQRGCGRTLVDDRAHAPGPRARPRSASSAAWGGPSPAGTAGGQEPRLAVNGRIDAAPYRLQRLEPVWAAAGGERPVPGRQAVAADGWSGRRRSSGGAGATSWRGRATRIPAGYSDSCRLIWPISSTNRRRSGCSMSRMQSRGQWR